MVHAFVSAGIPLNVFRNSDLRSWLQKNLKSGSSLPSVSTLRKKYLPTEGARDLEETKNICRYFYFRFFFQIDLVTDLNVECLLNL